MDADLTALLSSPPACSVISIVIDAPLVAPEVFLRLPIPGEPLLWDAACWGARRVAARGAVARWAPDDEGGLGGMARAASTFLAQAELRAHDRTVGGPCCYGGLAFDPSYPSELWSGFGGGNFVLPRFVYERDGSRAWLRLNALPDEPLAPLLDVLQSARRCLTESPPASVSLGRATLVSDASSAYRNVVAAAVDAIERGLFEKVVTARAISLINEGVSPWTILERLHGDHLVRFAFGREDAIFLGATPERLVSFDGREVLTDALAGSIAAGPGASERLLSSDKDLREHRVVVDAIREALAPLCKHLTGPKDPEIRTLRHLLHLATPLRGETNGVLHVLDLVSALHPTPAVCGLPRAAAASWLRAHEGLNRGWYAAPIGWFDGRGRGAFAVALRSALLRGASAQLFVGAGLVRGSTPEGELSETSLKARPLLEALGFSS